MALHRYTLIRPWFGYKTKVFIKTAIMKGIPCLCCGHLTIGQRAEFEICPVCFWEDDAYIDLADLRCFYDTQAPVPDKLLDTQSAANHGLTLRQGRANYLEFRACEPGMLPHVRKPHPDELPK